jgi:hypothetical protein
MERRNPAKIMGCWRGISGPCRIALFLPYFGYQTNNRSAGLCMQQPA